MKTILVTGGAGFIGSRVCEAFLDRGDAVVCVDDLNDYYDPVFKRENLIEIGSHKSAEYFSYFTMDIRNKKYMSDLFEFYDFDLVIHLAARVGVRDSLIYPELYQDVNVTAMQYLLDLMCAHDVNKMVFASSSSVYGDRSDAPFRETDPADNQISPYGRTKREGEILCEQYCKDNGLEINALRFFTVYGPRGRPDMACYKFVKRIDEGDVVELYGDGTTQRDYTYVGDIVDGIVQGAEKWFGFEIINLGCSQPVKLDYFVSSIESCLGKKANIVHIPEQPGDVRQTCADISKAQKMLEYSPEVGIGEGVKRFVDWYQTHRKA